MNVPLSDSLDDVIEMTNPARSDEQEGKREAVLKIEISPCLSIHPPTQQQPARQAIQLEFDFAINNKDNSSGMLFYTKHLWGEEEYQQKRKGEKEKWKSKRIIWWTFSLMQSSLY